MRRIHRLAVLLSFALVAPAFGAVDVTTCGQVVPAGKVGRLIADLDCAAGTGVVLQDRARLKLDGHVLSGSADAENVACAGLRCKIAGPGEIVGGSYAVTGLADLTLSDVTVRDQLLGGLDGLLSVKARRVILTGIGFGHTTPNLTETIRTAKLDAVSVYIHANGGSVSATNYVVKRSTIRLNGGVGIGGGGERRRLVHSALIGNAGGALGVPIDVYGPTAPAMIDTACNHSYQAGTGGTLGICFND